MKLQVNTLGDILFEPDCISRERVSNFSSFVADTLYHYAARGSNHLYLA